MDDTNAIRDGYEDYYLDLNPPSPENYRRKARGYARQFARLLDPAAISSCLDLGCGIGLFAFYLRSRGHDVVGVDVNETLASHARANVDGQFVVDDAAHYLASAGRKFDMISMLDVIEHIPREGVIPLLTAVRGALTEKGFALIRTPNMNAPAALGMFYSDWTHCTPFTEATLLHVGRTAGFSRVEFADQYASMRWWARVRARTTAMLGKRLAKMRGGHVPKVYHRHLIAQLFP